METSTEKLDAGTVKLTVTLSADEVEEWLKKAYKQVAGEVKIPGFRKGHVPEKVIDNYIGAEAVMAQAHENIVNDAYTKAVDAEDLRPIDQPDMEEMELPVRGEGYTFDATVVVRPELELLDFGKLVVHVPPAHATDQEVEDQIEHTRDRFATLEPVEDRGVEMDDFVLVSFTGYVDGEEYENNRIDQYLYEMGAGHMPGEFEEQLVGTGAGEDKKIIFEIPETSSRDDFVGKEASFDVEVHEIKRKVLPELDDALAQDAGYDSVDEMRQSVREEIDKMKESSRDRAREVEARRALAANLAGDIPEVMVRKRANDIIRDFFNQLESQGINPEQYADAQNLTLEKLQEEFEDEAEESVRHELALESLFRREGLEITMDDVDAELEDFVTGERPIEEVRENFIGLGMLKIIEEQAMHRKATAVLMDLVEILEEGTDAPAEAAADAGDDSTEEDE